MAFVFAERTLETSTSVGIGPMTLLGAVSGYQSFSDAVGPGNQTYYSILNEADGDWEVGTGTFSAGTLVRDSVIASTTGVFINFAVGTKQVFGTVAAQFVNLTLTASSHSVIDHAGLPGVPLPESFTFGDHQAVNHTLPPFNLLNEAGHEAINHKAAPFNLIGPTEHDLIDHTGLAGVNAFDVLAHAAEIHTSLPGVPPDEAFTLAIHAITDHSSIPGIGATPVPDVVALVDTAQANSTSTSISLGTGTWTVIAWAAWRSDGMRSALGDSQLRIGGSVVSVIPHFGHGDITGWEWYTHMGARAGMSGSVFCDFDAITDPPGSHPTNPIIKVFAIRTA